MYRIRELRELNKLSQTELAQKVGITQVYLSYIENGHKDPSIDLLKRLAAELHTTVKSLIA